MEVLVEDAVTYRVFFDGVSDVNCDVVGQNGPKVVRCGLETVRTECAAFIAATVAAAGHIWQLEPCSLEIVDQFDGMGPHLAGRTAFGDNVEDEWFIVYLITELTKLHKNATAEVVDNDGQFMLIEASSGLPKWAKPETCHHRVFIRDGEVHMVPPSHWAQCVVSTHPGPTDDDEDGDDVEGLPRIQDRVLLDKALAVIADPEVDTRASVGIQSLIRQRIDKYPGYATRQLHRARVIAPLTALHALQHNPQLISAAVNAFYTRDAVDIKACAGMRHFPPIANVPFTVTMTRCMYAQLSQQRFTPPKVFEPHMPPSYHPDAAAAEIGMKLAVGLQMLVARAKTDDVLASPSDVTLQSDWKPYFDRLIGLGYFEGVGAGTSAYNAKVETAKLHFLASSRGSSVSKDSNDFLDEAATAVIQLLSGPLPSSVEETGYIPIPPDSTDWMEEMGSELDSILRQREGEMEGPEAAEPVTADTDNILSSMKAFVSEVSGYKGVDDIAGMKFHSSSDEEDSDDDVPTVPQPSIRSSSARVVIDPDRFLQVLSGKYGSTVGASRPAMSTPVFNSGKQVASAPLYGPTLSTTFGDDNLSDMMDSSGEECDNEEDVEEPTVVDYMREMDVQLSETKMKDSFLRSSAVAGERGADGQHVRDELDDDVNLIASAMESVSSQLGGSGPVTNVLGGLSVAVPPEWRTKQ